MAYLDTNNIQQAKQKALNMGATHYFNHVIGSGEIVSVYFVKGDRPVNGNLTEVAHYVRSMASFTELERLQPVKNIGCNGYTQLFKLEV